MLITIGITISAVILTAVIIGYFFEDEVKKFAVDQINRQLNTKIEVKDIRLSLLKKFPNASLEFIDVKCKEVSDKEPKRNLFEAGSVFLQFSVWDIFRKNYTFKKLNIKNGKAYLHIDREGKQNFDILKTKPERHKKEKQTAQAFRFNQFTIDNMHVTFRNDPEEQEFRVLIRSFSLSGKFSSDRHTTKSSGNFLVEMIRFGSDEFITNKTVYYSTLLDVNRKQRTYTIKKGSFGIGNLEFEAGGSYREDPESYVDIYIKGHDLNIQSFLSLLPSDKKTFEKEYKSKGDFFADATVKGPVSKEQLPHITVAFGIRDGQITHVPSKTTMRQVNVKGSFTNGSQSGPATSELVLSQFSGRLQNSSFSGKLRLADFERPEMQFSTESDIDLKEFSAFFPLGNIESMEGRIAIRMQFSGKAQNTDRFTIYDYQQSQMEGSATVSGMKLRLKGHKHELSQCNGSFTFVNSDATIKELSGMVGSSDFSLSGSVRNLPGYLLIPDAPLTADAQFRSHRIMLDEWLENNNVKNEGKKQQYKLEIPANISLNLDLSVDELTFRRFSARNIRGNVDIKDRLFGAHQLVFNSCEGGVLVNGVVNGTNPRQLKITAEGTFTGINIRELFYEFENFGQKTLEDRHLKGKVDASVYFSCGFSNTLKSDLPSLYTSADLEITNGELNNFSPMEALSRFIRIDELRQVRFATLKNNIEIKNQTIIIPKMEVNSSAINLILSGEHKFDNHIEYHFNLLLKELLAQKMRKNRKQEEFGEIIEEEGGARLFIKMTGTVENPIIAYDNKGVREKIKDDMKKEQQTIKQMLFEEFGLFDKDTTLKKENALPKKENKNKVKTEDEFEFE